jgi:transporter family protein
MSWLYLALLSAALLGGYDIAKKSALTHNAVLPTLWVTGLCSWLLLLPLAAGSLGWPEALLASGLEVRALDPFEHLCVLLKAGVVTLSWVLTFFGVKHLPISTAGPIRASAPLFTVLGALLIYDESLSPSQWCGIASILTGYVALAVIAGGEGSRVEVNRWLMLMLAGTALGAVSGLYDKLLLQRMKIAPSTLQFWFTSDALLLQTLLVALAWWPRRRRYTPFTWRPAMLGVGGLLLLADQAYFRALASEGALVSVISSIRRSSVLISFTVGGLLFHERRLGRKATALSAIALGLLFLQC